MMQKQVNSMPYLPCQGPALIAARSDGPDAGAAFAGQEIPRDGQDTAVARP